MGRFVVTEFLWKACRAVPLW